jgi:hypothetical protein
MAKCRLQNRIRCWLLVLVFVGIAKVGVTINMAPPLGLAAGRNAQAKQMEWKFSTPAKAESGARAAEEE